MARKKAVAVQKSEPQTKEDPNILFESWFKASSPEDQQIVNDVDEHLIKIQTDKKNSRRDLQPLRVGMELSKVRKLIIGNEGAADPQTKEGRTWGAYRDSHLKKAGYSKSSCDTYVSMTTEARMILPDDLITALLDYTDDKGVVKLVGGNVKKPFGKYTKFLRSDEVQNHLKDGKLDKFLSQTELLLSTFTVKKNVEQPETIPNLSVAINTVVRRIFNEVKDDLKLTAPFDLTQVVDNARDNVRDVIQHLLLVCSCPDDMTTFEASDKEVIEEDKLETLIGIVNKKNELKKAATAKTKKEKKKLHRRKRPQADDKATDIVMGKYTIRKNLTPEKPLTPWEVFMASSDKPFAWSKTQALAEELVTALQAKDAGSDKTPAHKDDLTQLQEDAIRKGQHGHAG
jgi:hypothetical protein